MGELFTELLTLMSFEIQILMIRGARTVVPKPGSIDCTGCLPGPRCNPSPLPLHSPGTVPPCTDDRYRSTSTEDIREAAVPAVHPTTEGIKQYWLVAAVVSWSRLPDQRRDGVTAALARITGNNRQDMTAPR